MGTETRAVHLVGAAGKIRTAEYQGRTHVVMGVTALVEGVLHAVNSEVPELVLAEEFTISAPSWNGRPVMLDHPEVKGQKVSANHPRILEEFSMGQVFNTEVRDEALTMEAWIDTARVVGMGGDAQRTLERIQAADPKDPIEVSVGVYMVSEETKGTKDGKPYKAIWRHITPDHLALLPEGKVGACSVEMGCGTRYLATAQGYQEVGMSEKPKTLWDRLKALVKGDTSPSDAAIRVAISETESDQDQRIALDALLRNVEPSAYGITAVYSDRVVYACMAPGGDTCYYQRTYSGDATAGYALGDTRTEVEQVTTFEPVGEPKQVTAAADCRCHEGEPDMTKADRIKALLALPNNPVKDQKVLEAAPDDVLKTLEDHAATLDAAQKTAKDAADKAAKEAADAAAVQAATLAAAAAAPKELSEEEFMKAAPAPLRTMLQRHKDADAKAHAALVTSLKTAQKVHNEDALKAKTLEQLEEIAALLQMPPVDYSLRAVPRAAEATTDGEYKSQPPPDGYKLALEKRAAAAAQARH